MNLINSMNLINLINLRALNLGSVRIGSVRILYVVVFASIWGLGLVGSNEAHGQSLGDTTGDLNRIFSAERRALANNFPQYQLGSVHAYASLSPSFFKKYLPAEWRSLIEYPLDTTSRKRFRNYVRFTFTPTSLIESLLSYNVLAHLNKEGLFLPQMTVILSHTFAVPLYQTAQNAALQSTFTQLHAVSFTYMFSKSIHHDVKVFTGYRYVNFQGVYGGTDATFKIFGEPIRIDTRKTFHENLHYWIIGFTYLPVVTNWEHALSIGLDAINDSFYFNLETSNRYIAFGFAVTPGSIAIFRPYFRLQFSI